MTWAKFIAQIESELPARDFHTLEASKLRTLLVRAFTEGYGEGRKQRGETDTHRLVKFLREPNA